MRLSIFAKQIASFGIVVAIMIGLGLFALTQINTMNQKASLIATKSVPSLQTISKIHIAIGNYRQQQLQHVNATASDKANYEAGLMIDTANVDSLFLAYGKMVFDPQDQEFLENVQTGWKVYRETSASFLPASQAQDTENALIILNGEAKTSYDALLVQVEQWDAYNQKLAEDRMEEAAQIYTFSRNMTLGTILVDALLALGLGFIVARSLAGAAKRMVAAAGQIAHVDLTALAAATEALAGGDLTQSVSVQTQALTCSSNDEMGDLARAFNEMIARLQETGSAFASMTENLRGMVGQVAGDASSLSRASSQLSAAAGQSGQAAAQIAATIQQVARGAAQQSESIARTAASVEQMSRAIDGVARGAQEQSASIGRASNVSAQISAAIQQVSESARAQALGAAEAANTARASARTVEETIQGMQNIKTRVNLSAQKVQEMGRRSDQIGTIVETIGDIASQTNLLALNAAIEAARAGEHGKGFAVVADEVRKLAEKSAAATKEIAALIQAIQQTVGEAVKAMKESGGEVENGVTLANLSGQSLASLLEAAGQSQRSGEEIAAAARRMSAMADKLVSEMDSVSAVVEENTASTEEMAAGSDDVTQAIENIASISEENSAAVQEVSAGAEEMSAQGEEVTASARSLAEMARALQGLVARFNLGEDQLADEEDREDNQQDVPARQPEPYTGPDRRKPLIDRVLDGELVN
jgi:methyl-accepting chemotaxis protein